jgi:hypothetical protein
MSNALLPRDYPNWRTGEFDRAEDAAYLFGYYLILHCRDEAVATVAEDAAPEVKAAIEMAVGTGRSSSQCKGSGGGNRRDLALQTGFADWLLEVGART